MKPIHTSKQSHKNDPYQVLGVSRGASREEIKKAYKTAMNKYHPDKVAHLGDDLQELAKQKTQEISQAFEQLDLH